MIYLVLNKETQKYKIFHLSNNVDINTTDIEVKEYYFRRARKNKIDIRQYTYSTKFIKGVRDDYRIIDIIGDKEKSCICISISDINIEKYIKEIQLQLQI